MESRNTRETLTSISLRNSWARMPTRHQRKLKSQTLSSWPRRKWRQAQTRCADRRAPTFVSSSSLKAVTIAHSSTLSSPSSSCSSKIQSPSHSWSKSKSSTSIKKCSAQTRLCCTSQNATNTSHYPLIQWMPFRVPSVMPWAAVAPGISQESSSLGNLLLTIPANCDSKSLE